MDRQADHGGARNDSGPRPVQAILATLTGFGVFKLSAEQTSLLLGVSAAILAFATRRVVTPLANPQNSQGQKLVPASA